MTGAVRLRCGGWEAEVLPAFGANTIRLRDGGRDILRAPRSPEELAAEPFLYGTPLLLPPNRTRGGQFRFDRREYRLPINEPDTGCHLHGRFADAPFETVRRTETECLCRLENPAEGPASRFPFAFVIEIAHRLGGDGLLQETRVQNTGRTAMPLLLGFHTAFAAPERVAVPIGLRWERDARFLPTGKLGELSAREAQWRDGFVPDGSAVSGFFTAAGHTAQIGKYIYETSENFTQWTLFNGGGRDFFCAEPQSGPVDGLNRSGGHIRLDSGETARFWWRIARQSEDREEKRNV